MTYCGNNGPDCTIELNSESNKGNIFLTPSSFYNSSYVSQRQGVDLTFAIEKRQF